MIGWGCAVWGSGWYYPPYTYYGGTVHYGPHFPTYGYSARYNPWTGTYRPERRRVWTVRWGGGERPIQPAHRNLLREEPRRGDRMARAVSGKPRTRAPVLTVRPGRAPTSTAAGDRRRSSAVTTGRRPTASPIVRRATPLASHAPTTVRRSAAATPGKAVDSSPLGEGGNVYAGRDGNVYRRDGDTWQKHENGEWGNVGNRPQGQGTDRAATGDRASQAGAVTRPVDPATYGQLERDRSSRASWCGTHA